MDADLSIEFDFTDKNGKIYHKATKPQSELCLFH